MGLKLTVVPDGAPEADRLIALLKPPLIVVVIVDVPWFPCATLSDDGEAEIVKFGSCCAVTVSVTVVFCWMPPLLPVTVIGYVPGGVLDPTVMVIVELPEPGAGIGLGLKLTVVPDGTPEADRADGAVEATANGRRDRRRALIALSDAERSRRGRDREVRYCP